MQAWGVAMRYCVSKIVGLPLIPHTHIHRARARPIHVALVLTLDEVYCAHAPKRLALRCQLRMVLWPAR